MNVLSLKKMMFMMFEQGLLDDVKKTFRNYKYAIRNDALEFMNRIAICYTTKDSKILLETLKEMWEATPSIEFPNPKGTVRTICEEAQKERTLDISQIPPEYLKADTTNIYVSPKYDLISINGNAYDEQVSLATLAIQNIGDKVIFRENIDSITDVWYKNYLKLVHSINTCDIDYANESIEFFLDIEGTPRGDAELTPYNLIVDLFEAKYRIEYKDTSKTKSLDSIYERLFDKLKDTKTSLNLIYLRIWTKDKVEVLKEIANQKSHLIEKGLSKHELENYIDKLLRV